MTSDLATKADVLLLRQDIKDFERRMNARFGAMEDPFTVEVRKMENRIVLKLGSLMAVLLGLSIVLWKSGG